MLVKCPKLIHCIRFDAFAIFKWAAVDTQYIYIFFLRIIGSFLRNEKICDPSLSQVMKSLVSPLCGWTHRGAIQEAPCTIKSIKFLIHSLTLNLLEKYRGHSPYKNFRWRLYE